jgi:hypothetical protein
MKQMEVQAVQLAKSGNRTRGLMFLKRRKIMEQKLNQLDGMWWNLNLQMDAIRDAANSAAVVDQMKQNAEVLKQQNLATKIEDVEALTDDMADVMGELAAVSDQLAQPISGEVIDDAESEAELDMLLAAAEGANPEQTAAIPAAPAAQVPDANAQLGLLISNFE